MAYSQMDQPMIDNADKQSRGHLKYLIMMGLGFLTTIILSIFAVVYSYRSTVAAKAIPSTLASQQLPRKYSVGKNFILPPSDQMNLGSCWSFATIYLLESQYRNQGIEKGYLKENEYVQFSKQAYFTFLGKMCHERPDTKACHYGGLMQNSSEDQQIESLYYFYKSWPEMKSAILPESVCPYTGRLPDPEWHDMKCDNLESALKKNPIEFTIKSTEYAYSIQGAKELLFKAKRPLGIGAPLPTLRYFVKCDSEWVNKTDDCINKKFICPDDDSSFCHRFDIDARQRDGIFLGRQDVSHMTELGGHAMNVIGFNDDWTYRNRFQSKTKGVAELRGGFILHNSWRSPGHSVEYLMGKRSEENEALTCPNHNSPFNWIPASLECLRENKGDVTKCSQDIHRVRGQGIAKGADLLKCVSKSCDRTKKYVLGREGDDVYVQMRESGIEKTQVLVIDGEDVTEMFVEDVPFWSLSSMFQPEVIVPNHEDDCGYWIMPYESLDSMLRINWDLLDNFRVFDAEIEFKDHSYEKVASRRLYDLEYVKNSTKIYDHPEFDGPLPYDKIY